MQPPGPGSPIGIGTGFLSGNYWLDNGYACGFRGACAGDPKQAAFYNRTGAGIGGVFVNASTTCYHTGAGSYPDYGCNHYPNCELPPSSCRLPVCVRARVCVCIFLSLSLVLSRWFSLTLCAPLGNWPGHMSNYHLTPEQMEAPVVSMIDHDLHELPVNPNMTKALKLVGKPPWSEHSVQATKDPFARVNLPWNTNTSDFVANSDEALQVGHAPVSVRPSVRPSVRLSVCLSVSLSLSLALSLSRSVPPSLRPSLRPSLPPSLPPPPPPPLSLSLCLSLARWFSLSLWSSLGGARAAPSARDGPGQLF